MKPGRECWCSLVVIARDDTTKFSIIDKKKILLFRYRQVGLQNLW